MQIAQQTFNRLHNEYARLQEINADIDITRQVNKLNDRIHLEILKNEYLMSEYFKLLGDSYALQIFILLRINAFQPARRAYEYGIEFADTPEQEIILQMSIIQIRIHDDENPIGDLYRLRDKAPLELIPQINHMIEILDDDSKNKENSKSTSKPPELQNQVDRKIINLGVFGNAKNLAEPVIEFTKVLLQ